MAGVTVDTAVFRDLFEKPSIESMLQLDWADFEDFIQYIFECAGYAVEKVSSRPKFNVDLVLHDGHVGGKVLARVEVRRYSTANIIRARVHQFRGALIEKGNAPGFMITTSDFTKPSYQAAALSHGKVTLINGDRLLRYITYLRGSRLTEDGVTIQATGTRLDPIAPTHILEADCITRLDPGTTTVLTFANNKGGVAKTTSAENVGLALADRHHKRVLLIDMDGQTSLSRLLPPPSGKPLSSSPQGTLYLSDFFVGKCRLAELVRPTNFEHVWLIPAHPDLLILDPGGGGHPEDELALVQAIHDPNFVAPDGHPFDWIILDTPPAQSFYTRAAMGASHFVVIPATAEFLAVLGASRAIRTARTMRALTRDGAEVIGGVLTSWKKTLESDKARIALIDLMRSIGVPLFPTYVPEDGKIEKAHLKTGGGLLNDLFHVTPHSGPAAKAYEKIVEEVLSHVNSR